MRHPHLTASLLGVCFTLMLQPAGAQVPTDDQEQGRTRAEVKMERDEFLRTHRWDDRSATWVLKSGVEPPQGVKNRGEVQAERDQFLSEHRWDDKTSTWQPIEGAPRQMSTLTREQRRADTQKFMNTHRWDEQTQTWVEKSPKAKD